VKNIEFLADPTAGEVRIGCNPFLAPAFVSSVVDRVTRRFPRIVVHVVIPQAEIIYQELNERKVDFLITRIWESTVGYPFDFENLFEDSFVVVAGAQNPWVRRRRIALAELMNEPWVLPPPERTLGQITTEAFRACGLDHPRTSVVSPTPEVRLSLLATGRFISIFPTSSLIFPTRRAELKVLPVDLPMVRVPNGIITRSARSPSFSSSTRGKSPECGPEESGRRQVGLGSKPTCRRSALMSAVGGRADPTVPRRDVGYDPFQTLHSVSTD
jgi:DNA-binding transcriptional LysR family regulator